MNDPLFNMVGEEISCTLTEIWAAVTNTELKEGRGQQYDKTYHLTRKDALIGASGIGVMGSDGDVKSRIALKISPTEYVLIPEEFITIASTHTQEVDLKTSALAKLNEAEKAVLFGVDE